MAEEKTEVELEMENQPIELDTNSYATITDKNWIYPKLDLNSKIEKKVLTEETFKNFLKWYKQTLIEQTVYVDAATIKNDKKVNGTINITLKTNGAYLIIASGSDAGQGIWAVTNGSKNKTFAAKIVSSEDNNLSVEVKSFKTLTVSNASEEKIKIIVKKL